MTRHDEAGFARSVERLAIATFGSASLRLIAPQMLFQMMLHHQSAKLPAATMAEPVAANALMPANPVAANANESERPTAA